MTKVKSFMFFKNKSKILRVLRLKIYKKKFVIPYQKQFNFKKRKFYSLRFKFLKIFTNRYKIYKLRRLRKFKNSYKLIKLIRIKGNRYKKRINFINKFFFKSKLFQFFEIYNLFLERTNYMFQNFYRNKISTRMLYCFFICKESLNDFKYFSWLFYKIKLFKLRIFFNQCKKRIFFLHWSTALLYKFRYSRKKKFKKFFLKKKFKRLLKFYFIKKNIFRNFYILKVYNFLKFYKVKQKYKSKLILKPFYKLIKSLLLSHASRKQIKLKIRFKLFKNFRRFFFNFFKRNTKKILLKTLNFFLTNKNYKNYIIRSFMRLKMLSVVFKQQMIYFCTVNRGFEFNTTFSQYVLLNENINNLNIILPLFSVFSLSFRLHAKNFLKNKNDFLVLSYYREARNTFSQNLFIKFAPVMTLKKFNNMFHMQKNYYYRIFKRTQRTITSFSLHNSIKSNNMHLKSKRFVLKFLNIIFNELLYSFNLNLMLVGLITRKNKLCIINPSKIFKYKMIQNYLLLNNFEASKSYFKSLKQNIKKVKLSSFYNCKRILLFLHSFNLNFQFNFRIIISLFYLIFLLKLLTKRLLLCHN